MTRNKKIIVYILLALGAFIMIVPFGWMLIVAFTKPDITYQMTLENIISSLSLNNFRTLFSEYNMPRYVLNSVIVSVISTAGQILLCAMSGFVFARIDFKHKEKIFILYLATMMIPSSVTLIPVYSIYSKIGWIDTYLPLIVPAFTGGGAFSIFLIKQFFEAIPNELVESSKIDGAGWFTIFWKMFLPNSKPVLLVVIIFAFVNSWNDFFAPLIFLINPEKFTVAIGLNTFRNSYGAAMDIAPLMAMATLSVLPILLLFVFAQKYFVQGITTTGLK